MLVCAHTHTHITTVGCAALFPPSPPPPHLIRCVEVNQPGVGLPAVVAAAEVDQGLHAKGAVGVPHQLPVSARQHLQQKNFARLKARNNGVT